MRPRLWVCKDFVGVLWWGVTWLKLKVKRFFDWCTFPRSRLWFAFWSSYLLWSRQIFKTKVLGEISKDQGRGFFLDRRDFFFRDFGGAFLTKDLAQAQDRTLWSGAIFMVVVSFYHFHRDFFAHFLPKIKLRQHFIKSSRSKNIQ